MPLSVLPADDDETDDEDQVIDADEGLRHARRGVRARPPVAYDDDDSDAGSDQVIPDRVIRLTLPKPWQHLRIWAWLDYPEEVATLFAPQQPDEAADETGERIMEGLRTVITRHDGWRDRRGVLPQPETRAFWSRISTPLSRAIMTAFFAALRRAPTPQASPKTKRRA